MEHLSPLDASFLDMEDEDAHASLAIASVAVVEGPPPPQAEFLPFLRGRLAHVPRYRQKVRQLPLDLGQPVWIDDQDFDLGISSSYCAAAPGDDAALCRLVSGSCLARPGSAAVGCWVIGLPNGRWVVLSGASLHVTASPALGLPDHVRRVAAPPSYEDSWRRPGRADVVAARDRYDGRPAAG
jgi:diacylglycerol O-acyltransferase